jgi:quercetin dioxygenase-like cupin family protein
MAWPSLTLIALLAAAICGAQASDPDILTDFIVPPGTNATLLDGTFFTYPYLITSNAADPAKFTASKATAAEFPALLGQSVSYAALVFGAGTLNPPHIHPRASELLYVVQGPLMVGLVDETAGKVYTQTLQTGDKFVFPKGMVHFQYNAGAEMARAFSTFGGASPGTVSLPGAIFESGIDDVVLEKSFHVDQATVEALKHDLAPAAPAPGPATPPAPAPSTAAPVLFARSAALAALVGFGVAFLL